MTVIIIIGFIALIWWSWTSKNYGPTAGRHISWMNSLKPRLSVSKAQYEGGMSSWEIRLYSTEVHKKTYSRLSIKDLRDVKEDAEWVLNMVELSQGEKSMVEGIISAVTSLLVSKTVIRN